MLIEHGEMGGNDDFLGLDGDLIGGHHIPHKFLGRGMLIDAQILCHCGSEFQRMKPGLTGKPDRPRHGNG